MDFKSIILGFTLIILGNEAVGQTQFDSLKRNIMLDTLYQPSKKPTFVTEFAEIKMSGFIQPALYFDYNNLLNNDIFVTSEIPTTNMDGVKFQRFHMSANQSRLGFSFDFPKARFKTSAVMQGDFLSSSSGANTFFRMRHAYLSIGEFLVGQTWTNFGDVNAAPNTLDLEGPNSMPSSRVAQVRWRRQLNKSWNILLAIEEPRADYTALDSASAVKSAFPELVFKPKLSFRNGHWSNSVIYKPIVYTDKTYSFKKTLPAWGITSSLSIELDDRSFNPFGVKNRTLNLFGVIGSGTQGAINDFGGLGYEAFPKNNETLETLLYYGGYFSHSFVFMKRWSSTFVYSYLYQEKPGSTNQIFKRSHYFANNAIFAANRYLSFGAELLFGVKENHDNSRGTAFRFLGVIRLLF